MNKPQIKVTVGAIRQLVRETLGIDAHGMGYSPLKPNDIVDPIAAETSPMEPMHSPQTSEELLSSVKAALQQVPEESVDDVYKAVLAAIEKKLRQGDVDEKVVESFIAKNLISELLKENDDVEDVSRSRRTSDGGYVTGEQSWEDVKKLMGYRKGEPRPDLVASEVYRRIFDVIVNSDQFGAQQEELVSLVEDVIDAKVKKLQSSKDPVNVILSLERDMGDLPEDLIPTFVNDLQRKGVPASIVQDYVKEKEEDISSSVQAFGPQNAAETKALKIIGGQFLTFDSKLDNLHRSLEQIYDEANVLLQKNVTNEYIENLIGNDGKLAKFVVGLESFEDVVLSLIKSKKINASERVVSATSDQAKKVFSDLIEIEEDIDLIHNKISGKNVVGELTLKSFIRVMATRDLKSLSLVDVDKTENLRREFNRHKSETLDLLISVRTKVRDSIEAIDDELTSREITAKGTSEIGRSLNAPRTRALFIEWLNSKPQLAEKIKYSASTYVKGMIRQLNSAKKHFQNEDDPQDQLMAFRNDLSENPVTAALLVRDVESALTKLIGKENLSKLQEPANIAAQRAKMTLQDR